MRGEDINDAAEVTVGEIIVEAADVPAFLFWIIDLGGTLKLIDAERLEEETRFREIDGTEDRENLRLGEAVVDGDVTKRASRHEPGADIEPCGHREPKGRVDEVRTHGEGRKAVLTKESGDVKGEKGAVSGDSDMAK